MYHPSPSVTGMASSRSSMAAARHRSAPPSGMRRRQPGRRWAWAPGQGWRGSRAAGQPGWPGPSRDARAVAEVPQQGALLALQPGAGHRSGRPALPHLPQEARPGQVPVGGLVGVAEVGPDEGLERGIDLDQPLQDPDPVLDPPSIAVVVGHEPEPVPLAVIAPILTLDVVLDDPSPLGVRLIEEHGGGNAEPGHGPPGGLVPGAGASRFAGLPRPSRRARPGRERLAGGQRPGDRCRVPAGQGAVVRPATTRVAQLGPRAVQERGPPRGQRCRRVTAVGMMVEDGSSERDAQLVEGGVGVHVEHGVVVEVLVEDVCRAGHPTSVRVRELDRDCYAHGQWLRPPALRGPAPANC